MTKHISKELLNKAQEQYDAGTPIMTDAEYDALLKQYEEQEGELDYVPGNATGLFPKYEHTHPIASLAKVNDEELLRKEYQRLHPVILMPKFDGLTVVIYPDGAKVTRGNGTIGDNIAVNFNGVCNISFQSPVRGEAIIARDDFEALNAQRKKDGKPIFENRRNAVAGILRGKEGKYTEYVRFVAYNIVGSTLPLSEQIKLLKSVGFNATDYWTFNREDDVDELISFISDFDRGSYMYELDGMVLKSNIADSENHFGRTSHHPKDAVAFKFAAQGEWTRIIDVIWTVGRTGKVVPNAIFEPVKILDTNVEKASLHNPAIMEALGLRKGSEIFVIKANDIIPAVVEVRNSNPLAQKFDVPTHCPVCGSELVLVNDQLFCQNDHCVSKLAGRIEILASRDALDISNLSEKTIEKIIKKHNLVSAEQIFELTEAMILELEGFGPKSANKLYEAIQNARSTTMDRFIYAAAIPLIGRRASKSMAQIYETPNEIYADYHSGFEKLLELDGFGEKLIESLTKNISLLNLLHHQLREITPVKKSKATSSSAYVIAITGKHDEPRDYYVKLIEDAGHEFSKSVTKKTTHLFAGDKAGSKIDKARAQGVEIITHRDDLLNLIS